MSLYHNRQNHMGLNDAYFYTCSIRHHRTLMSDDRMKMVVIESWQYLVRNKLVEIYAFVVMPNHVHLIWNMLTNNGKESPAGSFLKYTSHQFKKLLLHGNIAELTNYVSQKRDREFQFWNRDPLAIPLSNEDVLVQKMEYIHNNPLSGKWDLCKYPEEYRWSSARYYRDGIDEFGILKHFRDNE